MTSQFWQEIQCYCSQFILSPQKMLIIFLFVIRPRLPTQYATNFLKSSRVMSLKLPEGKQEAHQLVGPGKMLCHLT